MKKILMLLAGVLLFGCNLMSQDELRDDRFSRLAGGHELYYSDEFNEIETVEEISFWVSRKIEYVADDVDSWDNPETVLGRGYGDCDDFAILVMNIAYVRFGLELDLVLIDSRQIMSGGFINHATVGYNDVVYNVYDLRYYIINPDIGFKYAFWEVFDRRSIK